MHSQAQANGWPEMAAKSATSLLRHMAVLRNGAHSASLVPPDKAFYLAGMLHLICVAVCMPDLCFSLRLRLDCGCRGTVDDWRICLAAHDW